MLIIHVRRAYGRYARRRSLRRAGRSRDYGIVRLPKERAVFFQTLPGRLRNRGPLGFG